METPWTGGLVALMAGPGGPTFDFAHYCDFTSPETCFADVFLASFFISFSSSRTQLGNRLRM